MTIAIKPTATTATIEHNDSTILTVDSSGNITPSNNLYPKVPAFSAAMTANQSIANATSTKVQFDDEEFDTTGDYDTSNYRFTPSVAGYYHIHASVHWDGASSTAGCHIDIFKNGSKYRQVYQVDDPDVTANSNVQIANLVYCNGSTDYIEIYFFQNVGSSRTIYQNSTNDYLWFQGHLVSV